jgi:hypothetical protein
MNKRTVSSILMAGAALMLATSAQAVRITGGIFFGGSWAQGLTEDRVGPFNSMQVDWVSGSPFEPDGLGALRNFTLSDHSVASSWSASYGGSGWDSASSSSQVDYLDFDLYFSDPQPQVPTAFQFKAWLGSTLVDWATLTWDGNDWDVVTHCQVPDGGLTAILLGSSVIGFGLVRTARQ